MATEADWNKKLVESPNPFGGDNIAKDVWINYPDVESVNGSLTKSVLNLLSEVKTSSKMMVIQGQTGIGKTHFIARLRRLSKVNNYLFVAISPISERTSIFLHIYREIFVSLRTPLPNEPFTEMEKLISYILANSLIKIYKERRRSSQLPQSNYSNLNSFMENLEKEPTILLKNVDSNSTVLDFLKQISEYSIANIEREYPRVDITFLSVLFKTLDKDLRIYAMRWLEGIEQDDDILLKLGVKKSISDEAIAQKVLYSIFILSNKPLLICFDQIESLKARFDDPSLISAFFDILVDIVDRTPNTLILLMALSETWANYMKDMLQLSTRARISTEESLLNPSPKEMREIVKERLKNIWGLDPTAPELETYPFSHKYINQISDYVGKNPRAVLNQLKVQYQRMKDSNSFNLLDNFEFYEDPRQKSATNEEFIDSQIKGIIQKYKTDPEEVSFASKENYLRDGLLDMFKSLKDQKSAINELNIEDITYKKKKNEIDLILKIKTQNNTSFNLGIEICNNENGRSFNSIVKKIQKLLVSKQIDKWIIIRDISIPVKPTWIASVELLNTLSPTGSLHLIDVDDDASIYACKKVLDFASSGDLELNNKPITRKEVLSFILNNILPNLTIIKPIFYENESEPGNGHPPPTDKDDIKSKIMSVANKKMMVIVSKLFSDFNQRKEFYRNIVDELVSESKLLIMIETKTKLVVSRPPSEKVL